MEDVLLKVTMRSAVINKAERVTGDAITHIVNLISKKRKSLSPEDIYDLLINFVEYQHFDPNNKHKLKINGQKSRPLLKDFFEIVKEYREGI